MISSSIAAAIAEQGPVTVERFMEMAVQAYYAQGTAFGRSGDFTTAPEISQVFGELIGVWCLLTWHRLGRPDPYYLVELGPGRGTLMTDLMRAATLMPDFVNATRLHLVETSSALRSQQAQALGGFAPGWHGSLASIPSDAPLLIVANEFLDALPIRQFERRDGGWHERMVVAAPDGTLSFALSPAPLSDASSLLAEAHEQAPTGSIAEINPQALSVMDEIANRLRVQNGAALFIDYGPLESGPGDSLQAIKGHTYAKVLECPGEADLTAHVDFAALARRAESHGMRAWGPVTQAVWLQRLGILERAGQLAQSAREDQKEMLVSGIRRLIEPKEMGTLFKVMALTLPGFSVPSGFEVS